MQLMILWIWSSHVPGGHLPEMEELELQVHLIYHPSPKLPAFCLNGGSDLLPHLPLFLGWTGHAHVPIPQSWIWSTVKLDPVLFASQQTRVQLADLDLLFQVSSTCLDPLHIDPLFPQKLEDRS